MPNQEVVVHYSLVLVQDLKRGFEDICLTLPGLEWEQLSTETKSRAGRSQRCSSAWSQGKETTASVSGKEEIKQKFPRP